MPFPRRRSKYNAVPTVVNGIRFSSKREAARYWQLFLMEKAGEIVRLELQPNFKFPMGFSYRADFTYYEKVKGQVNCKQVVEDIKGFETAVFKLKKKCFLHFYPQYELKITK